MHPQSLRRRLRLEFAALALAGLAGCASTSAPVVYPSAKARGAGAGAVAGALTAVALNWNEPDNVYRNQVDLCLKERGHKVRGWR